MAGWGDGIAPITGKPRAEVAASAESRSAWVVLRVYELSFRIHPSSSLARLDGKPADGHTDRQTGRQTDVRFKKREDDNGWG